MLCSVWDVKARCEGGKGRWIVGRGHVVLLILVLLVVNSLAGCGNPARGTADWYFDQGNRLAEEGFYDDAIEQYTKAIELNPALVEAYYNRGVFYFNEGLGADYCRRGFSASTNPSPRKLKAKTTSANTAPGTKTKCGWVRQKP